MSCISKDEISQQLELHRDMLLHRVMPFWETYALDAEHGGIYTGLDREGNIIETDKSVWFQGRAAWVFSTLYNEIEKKELWLQIAESCITFIEKYCFDNDKKMFFRVTKDGKPVIRRDRYIFSETFAVIAYAAYAKASAYSVFIKKAQDIISHIYTLVESGMLVPKFNSQYRAMQSLGYHMIMVHTLQELRKYDSVQALYYTERINTHIDHIRLFIKDDIRALLEVVDGDGNFMEEHMEGRLINPGHDIEAAWFLLNEGMYQQNMEIVSLGLKIIEYAWEWGWDDTYGGIFYFRDALEYPVVEYWHDMKFWWPHNEAVIALIMAYQITKDISYWNKYKKVLHWAHEHFFDEEYGEWFGYLHRDGTLSSEGKGNMYKGPFHIPRMYITCISILRDLSNN